MNWCLNQHWILFWFLFLKKKTDKKALHIQLQIPKGQTGSLKWACALLAQDAVRKGCWNENQMEIIILWCYAVQMWNSHLDYTCLHVYKTDFACKYNGKGEEDELTLTHTGEIKLELSWKREDLYLTCPILLWKKIPQNSLLSISIWAPDWINLS